MLLLLPLPLLVRRLAPAYQEQREALRAPFFKELVALTGQTPSRGAVVLRPNLFQRLLLPLCWILVVTALARPQWVEEPIVRIQSARDLMLAVDLSGSMEARDFTDAAGKSIGRLEAVKLVLGDILKVDVHVFQGGSTLLDTSNFNHAFPRHQRCGDNAKEASGSQHPK